MKQVRALNQEYFRAYGPGGYEQNYKHLGFSMAPMLSAFRKNDLWPDSLLDSGCATGLTVRDLRKAGIKAYGIEIADYAVAKWPEDLKRYLKQMDMRDISVFKPDAFDCVFSNANMYLTKEENLKWLADVHKVTKQSLYLVTPFSDYPDSIPKDKERKFLETKNWWMETVPRFGFERCRGTSMLFRKV